MSFDLLDGSNFNAALELAAACLIIPSASMKDLPKGNANLIPLIWKLSNVSLWFEHPKERLMHLTSLKRVFFLFYISYPASIWLNYFTLWRKNYGKSFTFKD